jgi:hypothetical protein
MQCDIVGMSETCVNWKLKKVKHRYDNALQKKFKNYSITASTTRQLYDKNYLPGGTATIVLGNCNTKVETQIHDPYKLGRWSGMSLRVNQH